MTQNRNRAEVSAEDIDNNDNSGSTSSLTSGSTSSTTETTSSSSSSFSPVTFFSAKKTTSNNCCGCFNDLLMEITPMIPELIAIIYEYLQNRRMAMSIHHFYDYCGQFEVFLDGKKFYIVPEKFLPKFLSRPQSSYPNFETDEKVLAKIRNDRQLKFTNLVTDNILAFLSPARARGVLTMGDHDFSRSFCDFLIDQTVYQVKDSFKNPAIFYLKLLLDTKITGYFDAVAQCVAERKDEAAVADYENFVSLFGDEKVREKVKSIKAKFSAENPTLLDEYIVLGKLVAAITICICKIESLVCYKLGEQAVKGRRLDYSTGFIGKIIKPILHSIKHNFFKYHGIINLANYLNVIRQIVNDNYFSIESRRQDVQSQFPELEETMLIIRSLIDIAENSIQPQPNNENIGSMQILPM